MSDAAPRDDATEVVCPHCHKPFTAPLLEGTSLRHAGFKCPHCKLFVAHDRSSA